MEWNRARRKQNGPRVGSAMLQSILRQIGRIVGCRKEQYWLPRPLVKYCNNTNPHYILHDSPLSCHFSKGDKSVGQSCRLDPHRFPRYFASSSHPRFDRDGSTKRQVTISQKERGKKRYTDEYLSAFVERDGQGWSQCDTFSGKERKSVHLNRKSGNMV